MYDEFAPKFDLLVGQQASVVGIPQGWLVLAEVGSGSNERWATAQVSASGTTAPSVDIPTGLAAPQLVSGPSGRVLLAAQRVGTTAIVASILDTSGNVLVPVFDVLAGSSLTATTDGTSFFVASPGALAKISPDGSYTTTSGFPVADSVMLTWDGNAGWYVVRAASGADLVMQRFDANGGLLGAPLTVSTGGTVEDVLAHGDQLLALHVRQQRYLELVPITSTGVIGTPMIIGRSPGADDAGVMGRYGARVAILWTAAVGTQLAFVSP